MSFIDCLKEKLKNNEVSSKKVKDLERQYESLVEKYSKTMGDDKAATKAAQDIAEIEGAKLLREKKNQIRAALFEKNLLEELDAKTGPYYRRVMDLYEKAQARGKGVRKQIYHNIEDFIQEFRSKKAGLVQEQDGMKEIVRELLGESTGDSVAKGYAEAIRKSFDLAHLRLKTAGGEIGKLDNYFPQTHARERVSKVSFEEWKNELIPLLDREKMIDINTGFPMDSKKLEELMFDDYQGIITGGKSEIQKAAREGKLSGFGGKDLAYRRESSRFYHFKDADSYFSYNEKFGYGNDALFEVITGHIDFMSKDIGIMEVLGPRPDRVQKSLDNRMLGDPDTGKLQKSWVNGAYEVLTNRWATDNYSWWQSSLSEVQNMMRGAYLGSASVSALTDTFYVVGTSKMAGLSGVKALRRYFKLLNPLSDADRRLAAKNGYLAELAAGNALSDLRFSGELIGRKGFFAKMSSFVNRASGLATMTKAAADSVALELESLMGKLVRDGVDFDGIDEPLRKAMIEHGIGPEDWDIIRKTELKVHPESSAEFLRSLDVVKVGKTADELARSMDIANKLDDMIFMLRDIATNEPRLRTRSITTGAWTNAGKDSQGLVKAIFGSSTMFKSFPLTVMFNHLLPAIRSGGKDPRILGVVGATIMGAFVVQMKEIIKGRDARDWDEKLFAAGVLQGGGLGLFGDVFFQDATRFGRSPLIDFVTGPVGGLASDVFRTTKGNLDKAVTGEDSTFVTDLFKLMKRNTPGVNLWYSRLAVERLFFDQVEEMIDPEFHRKARKLERKLKKEQGQGFWWRKGDTAPRRGPEL